VECVYEIPVRQSKEHLRNEIENLRLRQRSSDQVFAALIRPQLWEEVLARLRGGESVENISDWLSSLPPGGPTPSSVYAHTGSHMGGVSGGGHDLTAMQPFGDTSGASLQPMTLPVSSRGSMNMPGLGAEMAGAPASPWHSHPDLMNWAAEPGPPQTRVGSWAETMQADNLPDGIQRFRGLEQILSPLNEPKPPPGSWTSITNDVNLVQHLLALYFCWEYPTFASLSKEHFLHDFQEGRHRYCSPILVNALLALGCRFSTQPMTRANPNDPYSSGDHFFKESQRLFNEEIDHHSLTTIQALGIMSIREASCGRDSESWYYAGQSIRLALEMGLHRIHDEDDEDELAVQSATFWGAFALDQ
jgi:hypothetical protein